MRTVLNDEFVMDYSVIETIKGTAKSTVQIAMREGKPVIVKELYHANKEIYEKLHTINSEFLPAIYAVTEEEDEKIAVIEEFIEGDTLDVFMAKSNADAALKLNLAGQLCEAIEVIHSFEPPVIHRDIKPSNIIVTATGRLKLIDFDSSRIYEEGRKESDTLLLGTKEYAAPEQFGFAQTDVRSDIYSLGIVLREMNITFDNSEKDRKWSHIIEKCTMFDPKERFKSIQEIKAHMSRLTCNKGNRRLITATTVLLILVAVGIGILAITGHFSPDNEGDDKYVSTEVSQEYSLDEIRQKVTDTDFVWEENIFSSWKGPREAITEFSVEESERFTDILAKYDEEYYYDYFPGTTKQDFSVSFPQFAFKGYEVCAVEMVNLETGVSTQVPGDAFHTSYSVVYISNAFLRNMENTLYHIYIYAQKDDQTFLRASDAILIHDVEFIPEWEDIAFPNTPTFFVNKSKFCVWFVPHNSDLTITGVYDLDYHEISTEMYTVSDDRRTLMISPQMFEGLTAEDRLVIHVRLSDGHNELVRAFIAEWE